MKPVIVITGTRPEIIKMAPVIRALRNRKIPTLFVHCGQHYSHYMSQQFIDDLELPAPDYAFKVKVSSPGKQISRIIAQIDRLMQKIDSSIVLVEGDTNTVLSAALAANKLRIPVGHIEAGLRSFDLRMPEEHNRRLTDHISSLLFTPTQTTKKNLKKENTWGKIFVTGNTVIDAVNEHLTIAERKSQILSKINFKKYILATAHRAENVDNITVLKNFINVFAECPLPVVYPIHPRTEKRLRQNGLYSQFKKISNLQIMPPLGYLDFLVAMKNSEVILTDSGGIQEESTAPAVRKPVLVMRISTERSEAVDAGFAKVVGTRKEKILSAINSVLEFRHELPVRSPFGDGHAAERIAEITKKETSVGLKCYCA